MLNECGNETKGKVKEKWNKLTDDDLKFIDGRRDRLEDKMSNATVLLLITFAKR